MGRRKRCSQSPLFITAAELPQSLSHPYYAKLNEVLAGWKFDEFVEEKCQSFYADTMGRPSLEPGKYFRLLLIGYFEGLDSERGSAVGTSRMAGMMPVGLPSESTWSMKSFSACVRPATLNTVSAPSK